MTRFGLRIKRGLKGSVARNRSKRLAREIIRKRKSHILPGWEVVVTINQLNISQDILREELMNLFSKLKLIRE